VIAAIMVYRNEADALICGVVGQYHKKLKYVTEVLGLKPGCKTLGALSAMATETRPCLSATPMSMPTRPPNSWPS
jgi:malate dehydrogenase (oxaloacetate-decarboxylating)(NADP+)